MLVANNIYKSYGPTTILSNISFSLNRGEKAGLIGANGVGKTTLIKILAGIEIPDSGRLVFTPSTTIGYLPQTIGEQTGQTIDEILKKAAGNIQEIETKMHQLEQDMVLVDSENLANLIHEYIRISEEFLEHDGYDSDYRIKRAMEGLGINLLFRSRTIDTLSGGEKTRVNLAALLLSSPTLLLLDESTNNLDSDSLIWLEKYLANHKGAILVASHDRQFLNNVVNIIFEIDEYSHQLKIYTGNYDAYKLTKESERAKWKEAYRRQQEEIRSLQRIVKKTIHSTVHRSKSRDNDKFIPHFKGERRQDSLSRSVRNAQERLGRIEENPIPRPAKPLQIRPNVKLQPVIRSSEVIKAKDIFKSFGTARVLNGVDLTISHESKVVITGPNGSGKSTLLRILAGKEKADGGRVEYAPAIRIGFLPQETGTYLPDISVIDYFRHNLVGYEEEFIFDLVTCGLFHYEELHKQLWQLSLGQLRKLEIARMIATMPNVLILDEPTNHLSLDVLESFESAIMTFQGPVLSVSHDRQFIRKFGEVIWEINDGKLISR